MDGDFSKLPRAHTFTSGELERVTSNDRGRVTYASDIRPRRTSTAGLERRRQRSRSRDSSMSIRTARRSIDPSIALPPQFRTLSFGIEENKRKSFTKDEKAKAATEKKKATEIELENIDYHTTSINDLFRQFSTSRDDGLTSSNASQKLKTIGRNVPSPPPSRWFQKTLGYLFGGFGLILFIASILVFISWKPLGEPNPAVANLALAIVLALVWLIQAAFSFWQDFSSSKVSYALFDKSASMLTSQFHRIGHGLHHSASPRRVHSHPRRYSNSS